MRLRCVGFAFCELALTCSLRWVSLSSHVSALIYRRFFSFSFCIFLMLISLDFKQCKYFLRFFFACHFFIEQNVNFCYNLIRPFIPPSGSCLGNISPFLLNKGGFLVCSSSTLVFVFIFAITTYAFELWCWRRLLRVPWTARRSALGFLWKE